MSPRIIILVGCAFVQVAASRVRAADVSGDPASSRTRTDRVAFVFPPQVAATLNALRELSPAPSGKGAPTKNRDAVGKSLESALTYIAPNGIDFIDFTNEGIDHLNRRHTVRRHMTQAQLRQQILKKKGEEILWLKEFLRGLRVRELGSPAGASLVRQTESTIAINLMDEYVVTFANPNGDAKISSLELLIDPEGGD